MSTKMTDTDWTYALEVFWSCLARLWSKATDNRLFLEAMHFFIAESVCWRALPARRSLEPSMDAVQPAEQGRSV